MRAAVGVRARWQLPGTRGGHCTRRRGGPPPRQSEIGVRGRRTRRSSRPASSMPRARSRRIRAGPAGGGWRSRRRRPAGGAATGHPVREVLRAPDASQALLRVALEPPSSPSLVLAAQRLGQHPNVGDGQVHALGAGRRDDVHGVAGQEQAPVLHRLGHEAAHRGHALVHDRPLAQRPSRRRAPDACGAPPRSARRSSRGDPRPRRTGSRAGDGWVSACCRARSRGRCGSRRAPRWRARPRPARRTRRRGTRARGSAGRPRARRRGIRRGSRRSRRRSRTPSSCSSPSSR